MTTLSPMLLRNTQRGGQVASVGLWSSHRSSPSTLSPTSKETVDWSVKKTPRTSSTCSIGSKSAAVSSPTLESRTEQSVDAGTVHLETSFALDPPFTPVEGEDTQQRHSAAFVYVCRHCSTPLFHSDDVVAGSSVGDHRSGWPTFVAPLNSSALRLRTVLQKSMASMCAPPATSASSTPSRKANTLQLRVPETGTVQRGLAVEGDLIRLRGRRIGVQHAVSWRETCLRDENHRADPSVVVGSCGHCGSPVCQVTHSAVMGSRYVATASQVRALEDAAKT